jgi:hypothetical protein
LYVNSSPTGSGLGFVFARRRNGDQRDVSSSVALVSFVASVVFAVMDSVFGFVTEPGVVSKPALNRRNGDGVVIVADVDDDAGDDAQAMDFESQHPMVPRSRDEPGRRRARVGVTVGTTSSS